MDLIKVSSIPSMHLTRRKGSTAPASSSPGSLHLTTHHILFRPESTDAEELWIPLPLLHSVTRSPPSLTGSALPLVLRTRDFIVYSLAFQSVEDTEAVWDSLKALSQGVGSKGIEGLYAFFYDGDGHGHATATSSSKGKERANWNIYEPEKELQRMGIGSRTQGWRVSTINSDFEFCNSYPANIVVPAKISDTTLSYAVKYRSKGRIPGLVYLHWANLGSITRSSQPMVGITQGARSIQDEKLVEAIFSSHSQHSGNRQAFTLAADSSSDVGTAPVYGATATNIIIDARPTKNAYANSVKGAGTENMSFYRNCKKEYLGIDNIHVMRSSLNGVFEALRDSEVTGYLDRHALRQTHWLSHLTNILDGILIIVRTIHLYNSHVLVHCSDGWDRTSQLSALPQICLDPYYRTAEGLAVLIEKDWLSYGHRFADRSGHLCHDRVEFSTARGDESSAQQTFLASVTRQFAGPGSHAFKETCPVFQQFLDCIYQLQRQFPARFEWNEALLRRLQWEIYAGRYGTFLFNSEKQRAELQARKKTKSVWESIFDEDNDGKLSLKSEFRSERYDPTLDDPNSRRADADQGVLLVNPQDVKWWFELFGRGDEEMNGRPGPTIHVETPAAPRTTVTVVESVEDDPVLNGSLAGSMSNLGLRSHTQHSAASPSSSRPSSPATSRPLDLPSQILSSEAVSSARKFGWSAWKTVQKHAQEAASHAATRYAESQEARRVNTGVDVAVSQPSSLGDQISWSSGGKPLASDFGQGAQLSPSPLPSGPAELPTRKPGHDSHDSSRVSPTPQRQFESSTDPLGGNPWSVPASETLKPARPAKVVSEQLRSSSATLAEQHDAQASHSRLSPSTDPLGVGFA